MLRLQGLAREVAVEVVAASGERLPVLVNMVLAVGEKLNMVSSYEKRREFVIFMEY